MGKMDETALPQGNIMPGGSDSSWHGYIPEEVILDAITSSFRSLGDSAYRALLYYIRRDYGASEIDLARDEQLLESALVSLFGPGASMLLELIDRELTRLCGNADA